MCCKDKTYKLLKKCDADSMVRVMLNKASGFAGVVVEYKKIDVHEERPDGGANCTLEYNVVRVPKNKYQNLEDIEKDNFEKAVGEAFIDILKSALPSDVKADSSCGGCCGSCSNCPNKK